MDMIPRTNEDLVTLIQAGDREQLPKLWGQVERFVAKQARRRLVLSGCLEFEDLYNAGYIALVAAADSFDAAAGKSFIGWLNLQFKTAFAQAGGYLTRKQARDPLHWAGSLDVPTGEARDGGTLGELIADPASLLDFDQVEARQYQAQLHAALDAAMEQIPPHCRNTIRRRFYRGQTFDAIAAEAGVLPEIVRQWEGEALKRLRHPRISRPLREYLPRRGFRV